MKISISATKKQQNIAKILFGAKHQTILKQLEKYSKEKLFDTTHIDNFLFVLKNLDEFQAEKLKSSVSGKKVLANFKAVAVAKSFDQIMKAIKTAKCPKALLDSSNLKKLISDTKALQAKVGSGKRAGNSVKGLPKELSGYTASNIKYMQTSGGIYMQADISKNGVKLFNVADEATGGMLRVVPLNSEHGAYPKAIEAYKDMEKLIVAAVNKGRTVLGKHSEPVGLFVDWWHTRKENNQSFVQFVKSFYDS